MRTREYKNDRGSVLMTTLILALLVGVTSAGLYMLTQQQNVLLARSQVWNEELPLAEAGVEEAMAHLNSVPTNFASSGWTASGSNVVKSRVLGSNGGYYFTGISTSQPPVI